MPISPLERRTQQVLGYAEAVGLNGKTGSAHITGSQVRAVQQQADQTYRTQLRQMATVSQPIRTSTAAKQSRANMSDAQRRLMERRDRIANSNITASKNKTAQNSSTSDAKHQEAARKAAAKRSMASTTIKTKPKKSHSSSSKKKKTSSDGMDVSNVYDNKTAMEAFKGWASRVSIDKFKADKGVSGTDAEISDMMEKDAKNNPGMYALGYYCGMDNSLRMEIHDKQSDAKIAVVHNNVSSLVSGLKGISVKGLDFGKFGTNIGDVFDKTGDELKSARDSIKGAYDDAKAQYNKFKADWVPKREKMKQKYVKARNTANTYGKLLTHDPAKLFDAALDSYAENSNSKYAKYMTKNKLSGKNITDVLMGKYNADYNCKEKIDALVKYMNSHPKDTAGINKRIDDINKRYKTNIPQVTDSNHEQIKAAVKGIADNCKGWQVKKRTKKLAEMMIEAQEDKILDDKLDDILTKVNKQWGTKLQDNEKLRQDIRDAIRGTKTVFFNYEKSMKVLQDKTQKMLEDAIQKKVNDRINNSSAFKNFMNLDEKFNDVYRKHGGAKIEKLQGKLDRWNKMSDLDFMLETTESMTNTLNKKISFLGKWGGSLDSLDSKMEKNLGFSFGLGDQFTAFEKGFTSQIAANMQGQFRGSINSTLKSVNSITSSITKATQQIQRIQNQAKQMVLKWETTAMNMVKAQEQKIVNNILKSVKISFSGGIGSFKI